MTLSYKTKIKDVLCCILFTCVFLRSSMLILLKPGKCVVMALDCLVVNTGRSHRGKRCAWRDKSSGIDLLGSPDAAACGGIRSKSSPSTRRITTLCCISHSSRGKRMILLNTSSGSSTASLSQPRYRNVGTHGR